MTILRDMKPVILQEKSKYQNSSGQWIDTWIDIKEIEVAIYPANFTILTSGNIKYAESTNTGLSDEKDIKEIVNRIKDNNDIYEITFSNPIGKFTQLFLKMVISRA
jgi:hypothetical protein